MYNGDRYCLKKGRLELSLLDEMVDKKNTKKEKIEKTNQPQPQYIDLHAKKTIRQEVVEEPIITLSEIKLSDDISHTLSVMGEFLTQEDICEPIQPIEEKKQVIDSRKVSDNKSLKQKEIDYLLERHFGQMKISYVDAQELKSKIDTQIKKLRYSS